MSIKEIQRRDGSTVAFEPARIEGAIHRALEVVGEAEPARAEALTARVVELLERRGPERTPTVEIVQDAVEEVLIEASLPRTAKAYILYRQRRAEVRQAKQLIGVRDELKLPVNAIHVLGARYLRRDENGRLCETPDEMFRRVARAVAAAELRYGSDAEARQVEALFHGMLARLEFLPNSPTLMNAGTPLGQLSACYVLPVEDSVTGIFRALGAMAQVHKSGGGTGFSFSQLRPRGDVVQSTNGVASGPLSFMRIFDVTTDVIKQGGRRRGANMGILRCDHPDILAFITAKESQDALTNFNVSVGITDAFMEALERNGHYPLRNPRTGAETGRLRARELFDLIVTQAWRTGDPGLVFLDVIARDNPTPALGTLEATNPCGEQPLLPWESCNLGSINLKQMVRDGELDRELLRRTIALAVRFLDDVIDVNQWPLEETRRITEANRKIGLGVMGLADALVLLGVPYDSERALDVADEIGRILQEESRRASAELATIRGAFPSYPGSLHEAHGVPLRNATTTSIAPTGTISIIAGCSSGIEPLFAVSFVRNVLEGSRLLETNPIFEQLALARGFFSEELMLELARRGSVRGFDPVPRDVQELFPIAFDIAPEWHVRMQAAFQAHCDNAVSKTINIPFDAPPEAVERAYRLAYASGCKGITVYRYGSKADQVLNLGSGTFQNPERSGFTTAGADYSGGCPSGNCAC